MCNTHTIGPIQVLLIRPLVEPPCTPCSRFENLGFDICTYMRIYVCLCVCIYMFWALFPSYVCVLHTCNCHHRMVFLVNSTPHWKMSWSYVREVGWDHWELDPGKTIRLESVAWIDCFEVASSNWVHSTSLCGLAPLGGTWFSIKGMHLYSCRCDHVISLCMNQGSLYVFMVVYLMFYWFAYPQWLIIVDHYT